MDRITTALSTALGPDALAAAVSRGAALPLDDLLSAVGPFSEV